MAKEQLSPHALSCLSFDKSGERLFVGTTPSDDTGGVIKVVNVADVCFLDYIEIIDMRFLYYTLYYYFFFFANFFFFHSGAPQMRDNGVGSRKQWRPSQFNLKLLCVCVFIHACVCVLGWAWDWVFSHFFFVFVLFCVFFILGLKKTTSNEALLYLLHFFFSFSFMFLIALFKSVIVFEDEEKMFYCC